MEAGQPGKQSTIRINPDTMMEEISRRSYHLKGSPKEIGVAMGQALGERLEQNISHYIQKRPGGLLSLDLEHLREGAMPYLRSLPARFQEELEGLALGANLPLQRIAEWAFVEKCIEDGCSGFICRIDGHTWVGRNNDLNMPEMWGYMTIREVEGRIPTISFGMEGDVFTPTGVNQEKLWLHYNYLPPADSPKGNKLVLPGYLLIPEALETCTSLVEVETLLNATDRDGGVMLFAVDGKTEEGAIYECSCGTYATRRLAEDWVAGTNHYWSIESAEQSQTSRDRFIRLESLLQELYISYHPPVRWEDLAHILADEEIEGREADNGTVYANVACPSQAKIWYTFGGYPAASAGNWMEVPWPW